MSLRWLSDRLRLKLVLRRGLVGLSPAALGAGRGLRYSTIPGDGGVDKMAGVVSGVSCRLLGSILRLRLQGV